jgi:tetratricopeptide (TPR) repeat protein
MCLAVPAVVPVSGQASRANQAQLRWYDAYEQARAAIQRRDWTAAEQLLKQAQSSGTKPGPRVFTYGDAYIRFIPDYYLGIVYLNTKRYSEAEAAFARVRTQNLVAAKDPEYTAFERQGREATFNRAATEAVDFTRKGDFTQAQARVAEARATKVDDVRAERLSFEVDLEIQKAKAKTTSPPVDTAAQTPVQTPVQQPLPPPVQTPAGQVTGGLPKVGTSPTLPSTSRGTYPPTRGGPAANATFKDQGVIPPTPPPKELRDGLLAFFSGDYETAIRLLTIAAERPGGQRSLAFLACAKAGLVLAGRGDAAMLRDARDTFQRADAQRNLSAADRRFISPRVLEQLESRK